MYSSISRLKTYGVKLRFMFLIFFELEFIYFEDKQHRQTEEKITNRRSGSRQPLLENNQVVGLST